MNRLVAAAPISWGVCEVPDWGAVLPPARVLAGMRALGLTATELGPPGWLPTDPGQLRTELEQAGMTLVAGFLAVPLHHPLEQVSELTARAARALAEAGAELLVLAAATGRDGYDGVPPSRDDTWAALLEGAHLAAETAAEQGLDTVLHPHMGTLVQTPTEIARFMAESGMDLCLDTGHVLLGGGDPVDVARNYSERIRHVHLKDVDASVAARVRSGELGYAAAVASGLYRPLGAGDVDVAAVLAALDAARYGGWYVLEQDTSLAHADEASARSAEDDVRACLRTLNLLAGPTDNTDPTDTGPTLIVSAKEPR